MKSPPLTPTADIGKSLENLFGLVALRVFRHASTMLDGEVTFARLMTLFYLYRNGAQTIAAIAESAELSHAAASRMVDGLYKAGVVDRQESQGDRRQKRVVITRAGIDRLEALQVETANAYSHLMKDVPPELGIKLASALTDVWPILISQQEAKKASVQTAEKATESPNSATLLLAPKRVTTKKSR